MSTTLAERQHLLLDLLATSPSRQVEQARLEPLSAEDWNDILGMVRQHRLGPLLHWRLTRDRPDLAVPADVAARLAENFRVSTMRSLALQRELMQVHQVLAAAGIECVALKGAYLAWNAYPHPALRPLRDLDVLVRREEAIRAFEALVKAGYQRVPGYGGDPSVALESSKHLPELRSPSRLTLVELHTRITKARATSASHSSPLEGLSVWSRIVRGPAAGPALACLSPTDLLLHLVVHAAYDHRLSNGPLALIDLVNLAHTHEIDWQLFWSMAREGQWCRGSVLMMRLVTHFHGPWHLPLPSDAGEATINGTQLNEFAQLMLRDISARHAQSPSWFFHRLFPSRETISLRYPVSAHSPLVYAGYLSNAWRLFKHVPRYLRDRGDPRTLAEAATVSRLDEWLRDHHMPMDTEEAG